MKNLTINPTFRVPKFVKAAAFGTMLLGVAALTSCGGANKNSDKESETKKQEIEVLNKNIQPIDLTKPNLPIIDRSMNDNRDWDWANTITYKDLDGRTHVFTNGSDAAVSLYKAIQKYSTAENPNITDIFGFEAEVVKQGLLRSDCQRVDLGQVFTELVHQATKSTSDGGEEITVQEYTEMMDSWSNQPGNRVRI